MSPCFLARHALRPSHASRGAHAHLALAALLLLTALAWPSDRARAEDAVYVNRAINLSAIKLIAFDHDFTLAPWDPHLWEDKIFEIALERLRDQAAEHGIPPRVFAHWRYAPHTIRGLVADKYTGHILKLDAQGRPVQIALGTTMLGPRRAQQVLEQVYGNRPLAVEQPSSRDSGRYLLVNSPFDMARVQLFQRLCDLRARRVGTLANLNLEALYELANRAVDYANGDAQRLKLEVLKDPSRYRKAGPETDLALEQTTALLQAWGHASRTRALITNSSWPFVRAAMPAFYGAEWRDLFELIVVEAKKPDFFGTGRPFEQLASEGSDRFAPLGADAALDRAAVYRHGNAAELQRLLGLSPAQMLYDGDDLGQDGAAPKQAGWYTVGVVPELGEDHRWVQAHQPLLAERARTIAKLEALERAAGRSRHGKTLASQAGARGRLRILPSDPLEDHPQRDELRALTSQLRDIDREVQRARGPWGLPTHGDLGQPSLLARHAYDHADILVPDTGSLARFAPTQHLRATRPFLGFAPR